jgi:hypothetical protein
MSHCGPKRGTAQLGINAGVGAGVTAGGRGVVGVTEFRPLHSVSFRSVRRGVAALVLFGPLLGACSSPSLPSMSSFSSVFGSSAPAGDANASAASLQLPANFECPSVTVRSGAATLAASSDAETTATNLRYQVGISTTARECRMSAPNMVSVKVGVQGRVILGPQGAPGTFNVPIRYAVVYDGVPQRTITTRLERISVTVPPDDSNVLFSHVAEGIEFPMPRPAEIDSYVVYIGFDPVAAQEMDRKKPAPPRPAKPKRQTSQG